MNTPVACLSCSLAMELSGEVLKEGEGGLLAERPVAQRQEARLLLDHIAVIDTKVYCHIVIWMIESFKFFEFDIEQRMKQICFDCG